MKKIVKRFADRYIFTDELTFDARVLNLVCIVGVLALLVSAVGHIIEQSNFAMMLVKVVMIMGGISVLVICNKYNLHKFGRVFVLIAFCDIFFPLVFFANGGIGGGMAAYFVLTIILVVLLSRGRAFIVFMALHIAVIIGCYLTDRFHHELIIQLNTFQHYADNIISIIVAGVFIGLVIKGISALLIREQAKAEAASKAKGDFLSQMSHEMRTPLNAIIGMTSIMASSDDINQNKEDIKKIKTASTHLLGVINDILDMSKIEAHKLELFNEPFDFYKMIDDITTVMNFNIEKKNQNFYVDIDSTIPHYFKGDSQRLAQVITNLLSNAIKFTPDEGDISLTAQLKDNNEDVYSISVSVADTGIGITDEQMSRLFNLFEQADNSTSRRFGGTGLGLAISKQIVELMGGSIAAESEPNRGTKFTFEVSLPVSEAAFEDSDDSDPGDFDFSGKSILIAEDIDINREIITTLLEPTNLAIECAENGKIAVEMFEASGGKYDLIFMDIQMPEMDGYEAARAIRASSAKGAKEIPIIAMTANVFKEDIDRAHAAGMNGHLGKPIDMDDVLNKLAKHLT